MNRPYSFIAILLLAAPSAPVFDDFYRAPGACFRRRFPRACRAAIFPRLLSGGARPERDPPLPRLHCSVRAKRRATLRSAFPEKKVAGPVKIPSGMRADNQPHRVGAAAP